MNNTLELNIRQSRVVRNLLLANSSNYLEYFFGLMVSMLIARSLGPSEFGEYAFLIWFVSIAVAFANEGLSLSVTKHIAEISKDDSQPDPSTIIHYFENSHFRRILFIMIPLAAFAFLTSYRDEHGIDFAAFVTVVLAVCFYFRARHMLRVSTFKGLEQFWGVAIGPFVVTPVNMISAVVLFYIEAPLWMYLTQYLVVSFGFFFCTRYYLKHKSVYREEVTKSLEYDDYFERVSSYNRYITPSAILTYLMASQTEIFFLKMFASSEDVAFFNVGFILATAIATLVPGIINMVLLPMVSRSMSQGVGVVRKIVEDTIRYQLFLNFLVIGPTLLYADDVVLFLYGSEYSDAANPFLWLVLIYCASNFVSAFNSYLLSANEHKLILKVSIIGAVLGIALDVVFIYYYGLVGAIIALGLTMLWYVSTRIIPANRRLKAKLPWAQFVLVGLFCAATTAFVHFVTNGMGGLLGATIGSTIYVLVFSVLYYFSPALPEEGRKYLQSRTSQVFGYVRSRLLKS